jgi:dipeptidyl aminopeptidase/acylaminoacyl peptidase
VHKGCRLIGAAALFFSFTASLASADSQTGFIMTTAQARAIEKQVALPITKFYDTADPLPAGRPGELIRSESFSGYELPDFVSMQETGIAATRILYHSRNANGADVAASGVVLTPYGKPPSGGWPVIVWAHGTSGVARNCGPSLMKDLYYNWEALIEWAMAGYAVVAPDYTGLGTHYPHQYVFSPAQAEDVIDAVPAAKKAVPQLGQRWVAVGHSEGGGAVLATAEAESAIKDPNFLGTMALAPATDLTLFENINHTMYRGYIAFFAYGIKSVYPEFKYSDMLSPQALRLMPVVQTGCWYDTLATFANTVPIGKMTVPNWRHNKYFQAFVKRTKIGMRRAYGPIYIIQGAADESVPQSVTRASYNRMRAIGDDVTYEVFPGMDHDPVMFGSFAAQLNWLRGRFGTK